MVTRTALDDWLNEDGKTATVVPIPTELTSFTSLRRIQSFDSDEISELIERVVVDAHGEASSLLKSYGYPLIELMRVIEAAKLADATNQAGGRGGYRRDYGHIRPLLTEADAAAVAIELLLRSEIELPERPRPLAKPAGPRMQALGQMTCHALIAASAARAGLAELALARIDGIAYLVQRSEGFSYGEWVDQMIFDPQPSSEQDALALDALFGGVPTSEQSDQLRSLDVALAEELSTRLGSLALIFRVALWYARSREVRVCADEHGLIALLRERDERVTLRGPFKLDAGSDEELCGAIRLMSLDLGLLRSRPFSPHLGSRRVPNPRILPLHPRLGESGRALTFSWPALGFACMNWIAGAIDGVWLHLEQAPKVKSALDQIRFARVGAPTNRLEAELQALVVQSGVPAMFNVGQGDGKARLGVDLSDSAGEIDAIIALQPQAELWVLDAKDDFVLLAASDVARSIDRVLHGRTSRGRTRPSDQAKLDRKVSRVQEYLPDAVAALGLPQDQPWTVRGALITRAVQPAQGRGGHPIMTLTELRRLLAAPAAARASK